MTLIIVIGLIIGAALIVAVFVTLVHVWRALPDDPDDADTPPDPGPPMADDELARQLARVGSDLKFRRWTRLVVKVLAVFIAIDLLVSVGTVSALVAVRYVQIEGCRRSRDERSAMRKVVDIATAPSGGPVDLTRIEGFDALDESSKTWVRNLSAKLAAGNTPGQPSLHDQLIAQLPDIDC